MNKNLKVAIATLGISGVLLTSAYLYAIQGEKTDTDITWLTDIPIAHRGFDNEAPENSIKSFEDAITYGYTIELDVQLTKDNQLVVFHDTNLERMTGDKRDITEVNYAELEGLRLEGTEQIIPKLEDVVKLVNNRVPILVEIKDGKNAKELAAKTYEIMKDYEGRYAVQSFNPFILEWFKNNTDKEVIRCQLSSDFKSESNSHLKWYEKFILKNLLLNFKSKPHVIAYDLNAVDTLSVNLLKDKYPLICWTIKDEAEMKKALEKADNIIFDNINP